MADYPGDVQIYVVHAHPKDYFVRRDGRPFERADYYAHPNEYVSEFHTKVSATAISFDNL